MQTILPVFKSFVFELKARLPELKFEFHLIKLHRTSAATFSGFSLDLVILK